MGKELAAAYASAARVFAEANEALGVDLRRLCFEGPQAELDRTANTQPALLAASIAALRAAEEESGELAEPVVVLGHSLGEFSAIVAAGAPPPPHPPPLAVRRGVRVHTRGPPRRGAAGPSVGAPRGSCPSCWSARCGLRYSGSSRCGAPRGRVRRRSSSSAPVPCSPVWPSGSSPTS